MYVVEKRVAFTMGRPLSGKYGLPLDPPEDRHRWLFSLAEGRRFSNEWARRCGFGVMEDGCLVGPRRAKVLGAGLKFFPNLLCPTYLVRLERVNSVDNTA
jgi:hypothetical protein